MFLRLEEFQEIFLTINFIKMKEYLELKREIVKIYN